MITPIDIDLSELIEEFNLDEAQSVVLGSSIIDSVIIEYQSKWEDLIRTELSQSRIEYRKAMFINRTSPTEVEFGLSARESKLALMVEEGTPPFDEKEGFAASTKKKISKKGGWYLTIPFRHATPQAVAESGIFASIMPQAIYNIAKNQNKVTSVNLPPEFSTPGSRKEIRTPDLVVPEYIHKNPKYEGLVKLQASSSTSEDRSLYMTFRRVSNNSDPESWWNPGILPKKLMDKALDAAQIDLVAQMAIDEFLENM